LIFKLNFWRFRRRRQVPASQQRWGIDFLGRFLFAKGEQWGVFFVALALLILLAFCSFLVNIY